MAVEVVRARTTDGVDLALHRSAAVGPRRAVAILAHAMMANSSYLRALQEHLATRGVEAWALDFRGHGASVPPSPHAPGGWGFDAYAEHDVPAAIDTVARAAGIPAGELAWIGHSLGGLAGAAAFGGGFASAPRALVLVATNLWLAPLSLARRAQIAAFDLTSRPFGWAPARALGVGSDDEPRRYVRELARAARTGRWINVRGEDRALTLARVTAPTLVLHGTRDSWCTEADARGFAAWLSPAAPLTFAPYDGDHFAFARRGQEHTWDAIAAYVISPPSRS